MMPNTLGPPYMNFNFFLIFFAPLFSLSLFSNDSMSLLKPFAIGEVQFSRFQSEPMIQEQDHQSKVIL